MRHAADAATNASEGDNGTTPALLHALHFFAHLLAAVALTDRDDVLRVLSHLNSLVSRRADAIQVTVAASLGEQVRPPPAPPPLPQLVTIWVSNVRKPCREIGGSFCLSKFTLTAA